MRQQNITVSLPSDLVREIRYLAMEQGVSLSKFVARLIEEHVEANSRYRAARGRQREILQAGLPLGTGGSVTWDRNQLHAR